jgi:hypothetical protein
MAYENIFLSLREKHLPEEPSYELLMFMGETMLLQLMLLQN